MSTTKDAPSGAWTFNLQGVHRALLRAIEAGGGPLPVITVDDDEISLARFFQAVEAHCAQLEANNHELCRIARELLTQVRANLADTGKGGPRRTHDRDASVALAAALQRQLEFLRAENATLRARVATKTKYVDRDERGQIVRITEVCP